LQGLICYYLKNVFFLNPDANAVKFYRA